MDKKPGLSIAIAIQNKNKRKKMAKGGVASFEHKSAESGVHKPDVYSDPKGGVSSMGKAVRNQQTSHGKMDASEKLAKMKSMPKPKLQGLARGGMVKSSIINARPLDAMGRMLKDDESSMESSMPPMKHDGMSEDRGPSKAEYDAKKFAKGGMINNEISMHAAEEDDLEHPDGLASDNDDMRMPVDEYMANRFAEGGMADDDQKMSKMGPTNVSRPDTGYGAIIQKADGGMIDGGEEEDDEHYDSLAAAIMAKHRKMAAQMSGSKDEDDAEMMADGGMVDIEENGEEMPNKYYHQNEAALKENYDEDMEDVSQPQDSNEEGDMREDESENKHDMVSQIRAKNKAKMKFR